MASGGVPRWFQHLLTALVVLILPASASAHDVRPGAVSLREVAAGEYAVRVVDAQDGGATTARQDPQWPAHCIFQGVRLACAGGLRTHTGNKGGQSGGVRRRGRCAGRRR